MSSNSSTAFLCETDDGRSPRVGGALSQSLFGATSRIVVSGLPCRVGDVNCVVVTPSGQGVGGSTPRIGSITLTCDDTTEQSFVRYSSSYAPVSGMASDQDNPQFVDVFNPWISNDSPVSLDVFATHLGRIAGAEYFISQITSSIGGEVYANTFDAFSLVLVYAGEGRVAAGYHEGFGVVMYASGMPVDSEYKDAKPLRTPVFRVEQTSAPLRPIGISATHPMGIAKATANRVGALDRKSSSTSTGPATSQSRQSHACDANGFTFAQRKVDRSFLQDSPLWKYETSVTLSIPEQAVPEDAVTGIGAVFNPAPSEGAVFAGSWNEVYTGDFMGPINASYGGWSIAGDTGAVYGPSLESISFSCGARPGSWLTGVNVSLSHSLRDGMQTFPSEWHCFEDWVRSSSSSPDPTLALSKSVSTFFRSQGATARTRVPTVFLAQKTVDALNAFPWSSYYAIGFQLTRRPKKVQASLYIIGSNHSTVTVSARLRFTYEVQVTILRAYYSLSSASYTLLPPEQSNFGDIDYRVDSTFGYGQPSVACTRYYAGVSEISITDFVPVSRWRQFALGQQIEIADAASAAKCFVQLQSA